MSQADLVIANQSGSAFRADLNNQLAALGTLMSGSSAPSTTYAYMLWADTTNNVIKLRNSANNAWITLFTTTGGLSISAASTFNEDVTFDGATAGRDMVWDRSDNALEFADNAKCTFGAGPDLSIFHDADSSYIEHTTSGTDLVIDAKSPGDDLILRAADDVLIKAEGNEDAIKCIGGGSVELYWDNAKKLATQAGGVDIWGCDDCACEITMNADLGTHAADMWRMRAEASSSLWQLQNYADGAWENNIQAQGAGSVFLNFDNSQKLWTLTTGIVVDGTIRNQGTYDNTTANAANMYVHSSPYEFYRSTSSIKYKDNVTTLTDAEADNILNCRPVTYTSKCTVDHSDDIHYGLIAEEVKDVDSRLVVFEGSEPEGIKYDRFVPHLINLVKRLTDKIETLETKVAALEGK